MSSSVWLPQTCWLTLCWSPSSVCPPLTQNGPSRPGRRPPWLEGSPWTYCVSILSWSETGPCCHFLCPTPPAMTSGGETWAFCSTLTPGAKKCHTNTCFAIASALISIFSWRWFSVVIWYLLTKIISHVYKHKNRGHWAIRIQSPGNQLGHRCGSVPWEQGRLVT